MSTAHSYLNARETRELERLMREHGMSQSGVLRIGLRLLAGLPVPQAIFEQHRDQITEGAHNEERLSAAS